MTVTACHTQQATMKPPPWQLLPWGTRLDWLRFPSENPRALAFCAFSHHDGHDDRHFTH